MKIKFLIFSFILSSQLFAATTAIQVARKEKIMDMKVTLPAIWGKSIQAQMLALHDTNFNRVDDTEVFETIQEFIYFENGNEHEGIDPSIGEGVLISKDKLGGVLDTDLLKATFLKPFNQNQIDQYPVFLKFRAALFQRLFKRVKIEIKKPIPSLVWKVYFGALESVEINGIDLSINSLGKVLKLNLLFDSKIVKSLKIEELETIPESQY